MGSLIWPDWVIIIIVIISCLISLKRGFVKEALSLVSWVAAFIVARTFHGHLESLFVESIATPVFRTGIAFLVLFIGTLIVGAIINGLLATLIEMTGLSATDRALGMVFGLMRGLLVSVVIVAILRLTPFVNEPWWQQSVMIDKIMLLEEWTRKVMNDKMDIQIPEPSLEKQTPTNAR